MKEVYLSLGSNLGERESFLKKALREIQSSFEVFKISSFYETEAQDYKEQDKFLNCCVGIRSEDSAFDLLTIFKTIEEKLGRSKTIEKGPRCIDIDIIFCGYEEIHCEFLHVPHKSLFKRAFVLIPLLEILPSQHKFYASCKRSLEIIRREQIVQTFSHNS